MDKYLQSKKSNSQFMMEDLNFLPEKITEQDYIQLVDKNYQLEKEIFQLTQHNIKSPTIDIEKNRLQQIVNDQKTQYQKLLEKQSQNEFEITKLKQTLLDSQIKSEFYKEQMQNITKEFKNESEKYKNLLNLKAINDTDKKELENKIKALNELLANTHTQLNSEKIIAEAAKTQLHQNIEIMSQNLNQLSETNQVLTKNIQSLENNQSQQQKYISELTSKINTNLQESQENHLYTIGLKQENEFIKEELKELQNQLLEQKSILKEQQIANTELEKELEKYKFELNTEKQNKINLQKEFHNELVILESQKQHIQSKNIELIQQLESENKKSEALKAQIQTFEESFIKVKARFENVVKLYKKTKDETIPQIQSEAEQARIVTDLKHQYTLLNLENEIKTAHNQNEILQQKYKNLENQFTNLENTTNSEFIKNENLKKQLLEFNTVKTDLENKIQTQNEIISKQGLKISELLDEDSKKTELAHNYLKFINQEKIEIENKLNQMQFEVQRISTLNPIKDILKVTEIEISKIELELKKLALAAPNRKLLEHKMDQLFIQKTQLEALINESHKKISEQQIKISQVKNNLNILEAPMPI